MKAARTPAWQRASTHRLALGMMPPVEMLSQTEVLMSIAPPGMDCVQTMLCGSSANENAFKAACMAYRGAERAAAGKGASDFTDEELTTCMTNEAPGSPDLAILSFDGGFHGRTLGAVSCTHSKALHKVDVPTFDWPSAPFPQLQYPFEDHVEANRAEEDRCLDAVRRIIDAAKAAPAKSTVAAVIVEPIQAEGGDNHATAHFFGELRKLTAERGVYLIVDEVQTGVVASGKMWAHEHWELPSPPDFVTFSKKAQIGGYFYPEAMQPSMPYRIFNTWMGDPAKLAHLDVIVDVIRDEKLQERTIATGHTLLAGLKTLQHKYPDTLSNARGMGTLCAVDVVDAATRDAIVQSALDLGCLIGACGDRGIRWRPPLTFDTVDAQMSLDITEQALVAVCENAPDLAQQAKAAPKAVPKVVALKAVPAVPAAAPKAAAGAVGGQRVVVASRALWGPGQRAYN